MCTSRFRTFTSLILSQFTPSTVTLFPDNWFCSAPSGMNKHHDAGPASFYWLLHSLPKQFVRSEDSVNRLQHPGLWVTPRKKSYTVLGMLQNIKANHIRSGVLRRVWNIVSEISSHTNPPVGFCRQKDLICVTVHVITFSCSKSYQVHL